MLFAVGIVDIYYYCLCLTTAAPNPVGDVVMRQERSTLQEVVIWTQSCENTIQQRSSNALVMELWMDHELKFDAAMVQLVVVS